MRNQEITSSNAIKKHSGNISKTYLILTFSSKSTSVHVARNPTHGFYHMVRNTYTLLIQIRLIEEHANFNWPRVSWLMQSFMRAGSVQCKMYCAHPCHAARTHTHTHVAYSFGVCTTCNMQNVITPCIPQCKMKWLRGRLRRNIVGCRV